MRAPRNWVLLACLLVPACGSEHGAAPAPLQTPATPADWTWSRSNAGGFSAAWRPASGPLQMGPSFAIEVQLAETEAGAPLDLPTSQIAVAARMPEHQHGMLQTVEIERLGPGHYRVDGMRFHMLGYWQLQVDVSRPPITERVQFDIHL